MGEKQTAKNYRMTLNEHLMNKKLLNDINVKRGS